MVSFSKNARENINKKLPTLGEKFDLQNRKHQGFLAAILGYVFFLFFIVYSSVMNAPSFANNTNVNAEKPKAVKFVSDEVLIKIRKSSVSKIRENSADVGVDSLNTLNKEFKIKKMEKIVKSKKIIADSEIFQWYKVKFDEPREEISSTQSEVNTQLNFLINDDRATNIVGKSSEKTTGNANKDKFFSRLAKYKKDANIERAEPNYIVTIDQVPANIPNDPYYSSSGSWGQSYPDLWGIKKINSQGAWNIATGSSNIVVAVVDTGVDRNHEDLQGNMWVNTKEIPNNSIDDDANGYADDYYGYDFYNLDKDPMDDYGHGTHVAGTIGAVGNNGKGVVGVNWTTSIMAVKFLSSAGSGYTGDGASAIVYAADNGARVANNSWSGPASQAVHDAVEYAHNKRVVIVAAAGNSNSDVGSFSPAGEEKVITVAATDSNDQKASFSNYGTKIDVAAPGVDILSLKASASPMCDTSRTVGVNYCRVSGTSMATPHVSGLAALILSKHPEFTNEDVRQVLRVSADDLGSPEFDIYFGYGRINAGKALNTSSVLKATITSPNSGTDITDSNTLNITGSASGGGFISYDLSYGNNSSTWQSIKTSTNSVSNGQLGVWDISSVPSGFYTIRLAVTNKDGFTFYYQVWKLFKGYKEIGVNPLITGTGGAFYPEASGDKVIWENCPVSTNCSLMLYDMNSKTQKTIDSNIGNASKPAINIDGNRAVWSKNFDIFLYDLNEQIIRQITNDPTSQNSPDISGDRIVWDTTSDVYSCLYNPTNSTCPIQQITNVPENQFVAYISGDKIVWRDFRNKNYDIYLYDLTNKQEVQITSDLKDQYLAAISGNIIAWKDCRNGDYCNRIDIYACVYNPVTKTCPEKRLTTQDASPAFLFPPAISGSYVVWEDWRLGNGDIYYYDLVSNTEHPITGNASNQLSPTISNGLVVWEDYRNGSDLYYYQIPSPSPIPTPTPTIKPSPTPTPTVNPQIDSDGDGFSNVREIYMGTDPFDNCSNNASASAYPPDFDNNKVVRTADISAVVAKYGTTDHRYDLNGDGRVTIADISIVRSYYGKDCQ